MKPVRYFLHIAWVFFLAIQWGCATPQPHPLMPEHYRSGVYQIISFSRNGETHVMRALLLLNPEGFGLEMLGDFDIPLTQLRFDAKGLQVRDLSGAIPRPLAELIARDIFLTYYGGGVPLEPAFAPESLNRTQIDLMVESGSIRKIIRFRDGNEMEIRLALDGGQVRTINLSSASPHYQLRIRCLRELSPDEVRRGEEK